MASVLKLIHFISLCGYKLVHAFPMSVLQDSPWELNHLFTNI